MRDPDGTNSRADRIKRVVDDYLRLRDTASAIDDTELVTVHAELMPELGEELRKIRLIQESLLRARGEAEAECRSNTPRVAESAETANWSAGTVPPRAFGRYEVRGYLGRGGFADVYLGHDEKLDCAVAIKVLRLDHGPAPPQTIDQVMLEARFHARLRHPGMLRVHDVGEQDGFAYIVSDLIDGPSLRDWLTEHRPTWQQAVQITANVAETLDYVHGQGIVHRDIKPANILLTKDQRAILADLGLALSASGTELHRGRVVGTHGYMSPEQARGESQVDGRSDIYSLGAMLYEMLTRQPPPGAGAITELLQQARGDGPPQSRELPAELPHELERICLKAMAEKPSERYATAGELARELNGLLGRRPKPDVRPRRVKWPHVPTAIATWSSRKRFIGMVTAALVVAVTIGLIIRNRLTSNSRPSVADGPPSVTAAGLALEYDRRMAERVLSLGGTVDVGIPSGPTREINHADLLPAEPFYLRWIMMPRNHAVTDDLLREFSELKSLIGIDFYATAITDEGLANFSATPSLTDVFVHYTAVSDKGMSAILQLPRVSRLHLAGTRITDATLRALAGNQTLWKLDLSATAITDEGLKYVAEIPFLQILNIGETNTSDEGLRHLRSLRHIQELEVAQTMITERGLEAIEHWPLIRLGYSPKQVSAEWLAGFRERHPNCHVRRMDYR